MKTTTFRLILLRGRMRERSMRASLVEDNGNLALKLLSTGNNGLSPVVPVLTAVRDRETGQDKITVPAIAGAPPRPF